MSAVTIQPEEIVDTIREGLLVLTEDMSVEFANRSFLRMFKVSPAETIGRKLYDLGDGQWNIPALRLLLEEILPQKKTIEAYTVEHVFESVGRKVMRLNVRTTLRPDNGSTRILLAIDDATETHDLEVEHERTRRLHQGVVETIREPLLVLDGALNVVAASRSFLSTFDVSEADTIGRPLAALGDGQWNIPSLLDLLSKVMPDEEVVEDFAVDHDFPSIGRRNMLLNARKIYRHGANTKTFLLAMQDVTERRRIEAEREEMLEMANVFLAELNHRVMNNLTVMGAIISMEGRSLTDEECRAAFDRMKGRVNAIGALYRTLSAMKSVERVSAQDYMGAIVRDLIAAVISQRAKPIGMKAEIDAVDLPTHAAVPLGLMLNELVTNSIKYAFDETREGEIRIKFAEEGDDFLFAVADNGKGIDENARVDSGIGGKLVAAFAQQLGGDIKRDTGPAGTSVAIRFPRNAVSA